jgi:hypothetical protein
LRHLPDRGYERVEGLDAAKLAKDGITALEQLERFRL